MKLLTFNQMKPEKGIAYCRVHIMRKVAAGEFPAPVPLSDSRIAWIESEVDEWISGRVAMRSVKVAA